MSSFRTIFPRLRPLPVQTAPNASGAQGVSGTWTFEAVFRRLCQQQKARAAAPCARAAAFTLIETALALLAIGLGLMALFGLGRIGLQSSKESENDTRCAQMTDAVFETLREYNTMFVENARTNQNSRTWHQQWETAWGSSKQISFPHVANMSESSDLYLFINTGKPEAAYDEKALSLIVWNPRYELVVYPSVSSHVAGSVSMMNVSLAIYPDGDTYSSEPRIFHTTLTNPGGLP